MRLKTIAATGLAVALILGLSTPAFAKTTTFEDKKGDVMRTAAGETPGPLYASKKDKSGLSDITKVTVNYTKKTLSFEIMFKEKGKKKNTNSVTIKISDSDSKDYTINWNAAGTSATPNGVRAEGGQEILGTVTAKRTARKITLTIPAKAIAAPPKIGFIVQLAHVTKRVTGTRHDMYPNYRPGDNGYTTPYATARR